MSLNSLAARPWPQPTQICNARTQRAPLPHKPSPSRPTPRPHLAPAPPALPAVPRPQSAHSAQERPTLPACPRNTARVRARSRLVLARRRVRDLQCLLHRGADRRRLGRAAARQLRRLGCRFPGLARAELLAAAAAALLRRAARARGAAAAGALVVALLLASAQLLAARLRVRERARMCGALRGSGERKRMRETGMVQGCGVDPAAASRCGTQTQGMHALRARARALDVAPAWRAPPWA